jgi:hypothetical protein
MNHDPTSAQPLVLLNVHQSLAVPGCDSFYSLAHQSQPVFLAIATVLRFLSKRLQTAKDGTLLRQFLFSKFTVGF